MLTKINITGNKVLSTACLSGIRSNCESLSNRETLFNMKQRKFGTKNATVYSTYWCSAKSNEERDSGVNIIPSDEDTVV
jgi:hypothetical protein